MGVMFTESGIVKVDDEPIRHFNEQGVGVDRGVRERKLELKQLFSGVDQAANQRKNPPTNAHDAS